MVTVARSAGITVTVATVAPVAYELDRRSAVPSYLQLAALLRAEIQAGRIGPDEALPSLARLQQETGLAPKTIQHAIRVLVGEGLVYVVPSRGSYAAPQ